MKQYLDLLAKILREGTVRDDRTGTGTIDLFGPQMEFDLTTNLPVITTKKINFINIVGELLWILKGSTNNNELRDITYGKNSKKKTIWEAWSNPDGKLGPVYGEQLRNFNGVDQLNDLLINLATNPFSRRHVISLWNPTVLPDEQFTHNFNISMDNAVLPPCHTLIQFHVHDKNGVKYLSSKLYQRSADMFIGVPYNITSYCLLTKLIAYQLNYFPYKFIHTFGSAHIYKNHIHLVEKQLKRKPKKLPFLHIKKHKQNLWDYNVDDFCLIDYCPHDFIKADVSI